MSHLLPYLGIGFLLLVVLTIWVRQTIGSPKGTVEVLESRRGLPNRGTLNFGERIFAVEDWQFVSTSPSEIQQLFRRERSALATSWVRGTRRLLSQVMRAHLTAVRNSEDLRVTTEVRLALTYVFYVILCYLLIVLIWFRGPVSTRISVRETLRWLARIGAAFGKLMTAVDAANGAALGEVSIAERVGAK